MYSNLDYAKRDIALLSSKYLLSNSHLQNLSCTTISPISCPTLSSCLQLLKVSSTPNYKTLSATLMPVLIGLHSLNINFCYMIHVTPYQVTSYIGTSSTCTDLDNIPFLTQLLTTLDPTLTPEPVPQSAISPLLNEVLLSTTDSTSITSATFYPPQNPSPDPLTFLTKLFPYTSYTILFISQPTAFTEHLALQQEISQLITNLYSFKEISHTHTLTSTDGTSNTCTHAHHEHETLSCADNTSHSATTSTTHSQTNNYSTPVKLSDKVSITTSHASTTTDNASENNTCGQNNNKTTQSICIKTLSDTANVSKTKTHATAYKEFNAEVDYLLKFSTELLDFYRTTLAPPVFQFATYFIAPSVATSVYTASTYIQQFTHNLTSITPQYLNTWTHTSPDFCEVLKYLSTFNHPIFHCPCYKDCVTPTLPWSATAISQLF